MLIGIIADTHDHVSHIQQSAQFFSEQKVDLVIHAGDYCSPFTIPHFKGLPFTGILGNNDGDLYLLMKKFKDINAKLKGGFFEFEADGNAVAVYHGTHQGITNALYHCGNYDIVITGHTHEIINAKKGNVLAVNPGTANGFGGEATIALLDTGTLDVEFIELS